jgi:hypothetical protein
VKKLIITLLFASNMFVLFGQEMDKENQMAVVRFINSIKSQNKDELLALISFPFEREYPIPEIKTKRAFLDRYNQVFDDSLTKMIVNSDPAKDWSTVGSQGIFFLDGAIELDYEGNLLAVNYQTKFERDQREELIKIDKQNLYESINGYKQPVCVLETAKYRVRIDDMGNMNYRYVSWPLNCKMSDRPDLILENGEYVPEGSGGNHSFEFKKGEYVYECSIIVMGEDNSPPALLTIYKGDKLIFSQRAELVRR